MFKCCRGFSLLEAVIVLALLAILLNLALPSYRELVADKQANVAINQIERAVALARHTAINEGIMTTLCRSVDGSQCGGEWQQGFIVFTDRNADRKINGNDALVRIFPPLSDGGSLSFRAFQNRQYLQMTAEGMTNYQNGNFTYCPADGDSRLARQLIINRSGRTYTAKDRDQDGVREGANGKPISC